MSPYKKNILYIWDADYPWDIRVDKITQSFAKSNYNVHILCRNLRGEPALEMLAGVTINRLRPVRHEKLNCALSTPLPISPIWLKRIYEVVKENRIELIIVRDLPLSLNALIAGRKFHVPVVFDMAEDYPAMLAGINRVNKSITNKIIRNPNIASFVEKIVCRNADAIMVVVEESKDRLVRLGIDLNKIIVVSNTPDLDFFNNEKNERKPDSFFQLLYIGGIQMGRGIQTVIEAISILSPILPKIHFKIIGDGYAKEWLRDIAIANKVEQYVEFIGFVGHGQLASYISTSDICVIPHILNDQTRTTIPNKLFDYMAMAKPVISTDIPPLTRIINQENCGLVFNNKDPHDLAEKIMLLQDKKKRMEYGENGLTAIRNRYNWDIDFKKLLKLINRLSDLNDE